MWVYTLSTLAVGFLAAVVCKKVIVKAMTSSPSSHQKNSQALKSFPWRTRIVLAFLSFVTDSCRYRDGTMNRRFLNLFEIRSLPRAGKIVSSADHTVDEFRNLWIRVFTPNESPPQKKPFPVILFFHGGGFAFLGADSFAYDAVCRKFASTVSAIVVSVNYRLSPEHKFPSQYDDGFDALAFLEKDILGTNADLSRCFLAGDSAGANLAHHVAVRACGEEGRNRLERVRVKGVVAIQPFFGGEERTAAEIRLSDAPVVNVERTDWMWKAFLPEGASRDHAAANVCGPQGEDISGIRDFPKTMVVVGGKDPLQDWQRRYYTWLISSGKEAELFEYPDAFHAFYIFPEIPESKQLILQVKDFIHPSSSSSS